jgi:hypothetical protein
VKIEMVHLLIIDHYPVAILNNISLLIADVAATSVPHQFIRHLAKPQLKVSAFIYIYID